MRTDNDMEPDENYRDEPAALMKYVKTGRRESLPSATKASGWNWTPMMHSASLFSMASTTPSSETAEITNPGATSFTA